MFPCPIPSSQRVVLNHEAHGKRRPTHPVSESWGKHGHPRYLNSLPSIGSSAVLGFPERPSKNRRAARTKFSPSLSLSFYLLPPLRDPLIGDAWVLHSEIWYDSRNHPPRVYDYTTVRWPYSTDYLPNCRSQIPSPLSSEIYLSSLPYPYVFEKFRKPNYLFTIN